MKPYGIVVFPDEHPGHYPAKVFEDGIIPSKDLDSEEVTHGEDYPLVVFFETENGRNAEMESLLSKWPGVMFCPITINSGKKTQPNPKATEFIISNRGVLPA